MIKVEVIEKFTLADYEKLKNVEKVMARKENEFGVGDTFECDKEMVEYLTGGNAKNKVVVKVIEVMPEKKIPVGESVQPIEKVIEAKIEEVVKKATKKTTKKKKEK